VKPPVVKHRVEPEYPAVARKMRMTWETVLDVFVRSDGTVCTVKVVHAGPPTFDEPVVKAVHQWTFTPATRKGKPVDCVFSLTVRFR